MICPKCHRFKRKRLFNRHKKDCIPSKVDLAHYARSSGGRKNRT